MRIPSVLVAVLVLGACGDDGGGGGMDPMPDAPMALRYPISFMVRGDVPLFLAFADDDGTWTPIESNAANMYMITATNRHAIAVVCGDVATGYRTNVVQRTRFDDDPFFFCSNSEGLSPQPFAITGQMMQPGEVQMVDTDDGTTSPWTFDLSVSGGTHDLVAFGNSMVLVRRGVSVTAPATLPAIDLAQGGAAYATTVVLLGNALGDETVETVATLFTGNDLFDYTRTGTTLFEVPSTLLGANDFQFAEIRATTATTSRSASIEGGAVPMITLMPRLEGITFTDGGATWSELPDSTAQVRLYSSDGSAYLTIEATGGYIAGDTELALTLDIPGFDDAWRVTGAVYHTFAAYDDELGETNVSAGPTATRRGPARSETASRRRMDRARFGRSGGAGAARVHR